MFGCIGRLGCAAVLLVVGALGWQFRDKWMPKVRDAVTTDAPAPTESWAPVTAAGQQRAKTKVLSLDKANGPAYVNVDPADFAAYILGASLTQLTVVDSAPEAIVEGDELFIRTRIKLAELGGKKALGPLANMFGDTEPLLVAGRVEALRPGLAQFRLTEVGIRELKVPAAVVKTLAKRWGLKDRPQGTAAEALPLPLPAHVGDVRLANGKVTLYRVTP